ncbi:Hypothetical protein CINCED_3A023680 [Cinara cedri]|uniref:Uncharacterized protein n=1 Tax=Cinara cedri TaxID=506608 RepID=A0A5E4MGP9_9HEMI|nr:Hypothetical protein CINCED_3A023680 [Cinara cedri]
MSGHFSFRPSPDNVTDFQPDRDDAPQQPPPPPPSSSTARARYVYGNPTASACSVRPPPQFSSGTTRYECAFEKQCPPPRSCLERVESGRCRARFSSFCLRFKNGKIEEETCHVVV